MEEKKAQKLFIQIQVYYNEFEENHNKFIEKGNKSAAARARKALGEIKKLVTGYRKENLNEIA